MDPGKSLKEEPDDPDATYEATISVEEQRVVATVVIDMPDSGTSGNVGPALAALAVLPFGAFAVRHRRRVLVGLALLVVASPVSGCAGVGITGTVTTDLAFTKLASMGQDAPKKKPTWRLSGGTGTMVLDLTIEVTTTDAKGKEQTEKQRCIVELGLRSEGALYRDGVVKAPKL